MIEDQNIAAIANEKVKFGNLPVQIQTVIATVPVSFQDGDLATSTPTYWKQIVTKDWQQAIAELQDFGDAYGPHQSLEARILTQGFNTRTRNA